MGTLLLFLIFLAVCILTYWYIGMLKNLFKSFKSEIANELMNEKKLLIDLRKPNRNERKYNPFPKTIEPAILINGMPSDQSFYRIIKFKHLDKIQEAWVEINTSPFKQTEIIIKPI